ncbi:GTPase [Massilia sp.]|uniref:GTPase n=1 Tax=Massilia sp. TaxID=1882437 RepID=UPI0028A17896|nr:GTPase [Massilia sp.]
MKPKDIRLKLRDIEKGQHAPKPVIAACGLMNAGKSFLLNMLTRHLEQEFFRTNDFRETVENAQYDAERYIYLDTPGIDATRDDDEHAWKGVKQADVILFVHQPQGELDEAEAGFLRTLAPALGSHAGDSIVIVISKSEKENPEKIAAIEERIRQQCADQLGFEPRIFQVSSKRYQQGVLKGQSGLVAASGMDQLIAHVQTVAASVQAIRARKNLAEVEALLNGLDQAEQQLQARRTRLRGTVVDGFAAFNGQVGQLRRFLGDSASKYTQI